eukprot:10300562-Lingulodinium_polyedra.AAC.1
MQASARAPIRSRACRRKRKACECQRACNFKSQVTRRFKFNAMQCIASSRSAMRSIEEQCDAV